MIDFEKSASDPRRLFRSSFQLVEEEKFRKTCFPTLMKLEQKLEKAIVAWEQGVSSPISMYLLATD